jgi:hypothetical protein
MVSSPLALSASAILRSEMDASSCERRVSTSER